MALSRSFLSTRAFRGNSKMRYVPAAVIAQTWTNPIASDNDGFSASHAGASAAGTRNMTLGGALCTAGVGINGHPRNVVIVVTHASAVVAMSGTITGTDIHDQGLTEAWAVTAGTTSKTFTGKKAFKTVTSITETIAATAAANTIIAGSGNVLGFATKCTVASALKEIEAGSVVTTGTLVVASTVSTADKRGTYAPNTVPDGANDYTVYFLSDDPENDLAH